MMRKKYHILLLSILCLCGPLWSQAEADNILTLEQRVNIAIGQNPLVLSAFQQLQASLARVRQAKALPQASLDYDSDLPFIFSLLSEKIAG